MPLEFKPIDEASRHIGIIEVLNCMVLNRGGFGNSGVGYDDVKAAVNDVANLPGERLGAVSGGEIGRHDFGAAASGANFIQKPVRFLPPPPSMHDYAPALLPP